MKQRGFTVVELLVLTLLLILVGITFWIQKNNIETAARDDKRKVSINAMYYSLEEVYYPTHKYYPKTLTPTSLPSVDKVLFNDPNGVMIGKSQSDLRYEAKNCTGDQCKSYELRARLQNEADFVKDSRNN